MEPNPYLIPVLEKNRQLNNSEFLVEQAIISNSNKEYSDFFIHPRIIDGSYVKKTNKKIRVKNKTISQLERKSNLKFNIIILDIEGGEYDLVISNIDYLSKNIKKIIIEFHPGIIGRKKCEEVEKVLKEKFDCLEENKNVKAYINKSFC